MKRILADLPCSTALAAPAAQPYSVYENSRFGFSVEVPEALQPEGDSDDGDGQRFSSGSGDATARLELPGQGRAARAMIADSQGSTVAYTFARGSGSVVSGCWRDRIFHKKAIRMKDRCPMLEIKHEARARRLYDLVTFAEGEVVRG